MPCLNIAWYKIYKHIRYTIFQGKEKSLMRSLILSVLITIVGTVVFAQEVLYVVGYEEIVATPQPAQFVYRLNDIVQFT